MSDYDRRYIPKSGKLQLIQHQIYKRDLKKLSKKKVTRNFHIEYLAFWLIITVQMDIFNYITFLKD